MTREQTAERIDGFRHDRVTMIFHWLVVVILLATFLLGLNIDDFARGAPRVDARSAHFMLGICLCLVLIARGRWRSSGQASRSPIESSPLHERAKTMMHAVLYWGAFVVIGLGIINAWSRGDSIFNLFSIPPLGPADGSFKALSEPVHMYAAYVLVALSGLHALAAIAGYYLGGGGVARMLPGGKGADAAKAAGL